MYNCDNGKTLNGEKDWKNLLVVWATSESLADNMTGRGSSRAGHHCAHKAATAVMLLWTAEKLMMVTNQR
jgi:hypothetical protein